MKTISDPLSYPHPRQPTVRFLNPNASERSSIKIQRNSKRSWRQDEQSFIRRFPYRDSGSTNTAGPTAAAFESLFPESIFLLSTNQSDNNGVHDGYFFDYSCRSCRWRNREAIDAGERSWWFYRHDSARHRWRVHSHLPRPGRRLVQGGTTSGLDHVDRRRHNPVAAVSVAFQAQTIAFATEAKAEKGQSTAALQNGARAKTNAASILISDALPFGRLFMASQKRSAMQSTTRSSAVAHTML